MKYLYKYPQNAFPYDDLVDGVNVAAATTWNYELLDTGVFNDDRYFDVFVEYAKAGPDDILIRSACAIADRRLPLQCCRPFGSATPGHGGRISRSPLCESDKGVRPVPSTGDLLCIARVLRLLSGSPKTRPTTNASSALPTHATYVKDRNQRLRGPARRRRSIRARPGTKAAAHYHATSSAGDDRRDPPTAARCHRRSLRNRVSTNSSNSAAARPTSSIGRSRRPVSATMRPM